MLAHLSIKNFAIVEQLDLELNSGMTVLTGETGAGKSIMLDALSLTLGNRSDTSAIRIGTDKAELAATFHIAHIKPALKWLKDKDLDDGDECILRRVITAEGRSRSYINGQPCPLQDLRQLGNMLIDIHSQHEHQSLLKKETHRRVLDEFSSNQSILQEIKQIYHQWHEKQQLLTQLQNRVEDQNAKEQLLSYQVNELSQLNLQDGELADLEAEQKQLTHAENLMTTNQQILDICKEQDDGSILSQLNYCTNLLNNLPFKNQAIMNVEQLLSTAQIQIEEAVTELIQDMSLLENDPQQLQTVDERLSTIYELARKHKIQSAELPDFFRGLTEELNQLQNVDQHIGLLEQEVVGLAEQYHDLAAKLSKQRQQSAKRIKRLISQEIRQLGMPDAQFTVQLSPLAKALLHPNGREEVEFLVTTNPGQPARPLNKVVSGGELSRISLAIQMIAAQHSKIPSMIFDEIDVGIGGGIAETVGRCLRSLGQKGQVLCVTHQPQVASQGHQHLYISKHSKRNQTFTEITTLSRAARAEEIARMLGGITITDQTLAHAEEILEAAI